MKKFLLLFVSFAVYFSTFAQGHGMGFLKKGSYGDLSYESWDSVINSSEKDPVISGKAFTSFANFNGEETRVLYNEFTQKYLGKPLLKAWEEAVPVKMTGVVNTFSYTKSGVEIKPTPIQRNAYSDEEGLMDPSSGIIWWSRTCGNLCLIETKTAGGLSRSFSTPKPAGFDGGKQGGSGNISWEQGYAIYSQGINDRTQMFLFDAKIYTEIQNAKQCCGGSQGNVLMTGAQVIPVAAQQPVNGNGNGNSGVFFGTLLGSALGTTLGNIISPDRNIFINQRPMYYPRWGNSGWWITPPPPIQPAGGGWTPRQGGG